MKIKTIMTLSLMTALVFTSGCGSFGKKYNEPEIQKVKRIAILSFALYQDKPKDSLGLGSLTKGVGSNTTSDKSPEMKALAKSVYLDLSKGLQSRFKKKVYALNRVKSDRKYNQLYNKKMTGLRMGGYRGDKVELIFVEGILDQTNFQGLPYAKKVEMAKSVGADAFIEFNASQGIEQGWGLGNLTGTADFAFKTRSNITMYSTRSEEPILRVQNVDGVKSRNSSELRKGTSQIKKLALIGHESAKSSIKALLKSIKQ